MEISEIRRMNLRRLVSEHGGMGHLARKLGLTRGSYISQMLMDPPVRPISEKVVRKWESLLRLPTGWFDGQPRANAGATHPAQVDAPVLTAVLSEVLDALRAAKINLSPAGISELVALHYSDAVSSGRVDPDRIRRIVGLIRR